MAQHTQATSSNALGSLWGTVATAANAVSSVLSTTVEGVEMIDTVVKNASTKQRIRAKVDMADFTMKLTEEKAQEQALRQLNVKKFCSTSDDHAALYKRNFDSIARLLGVTANGVAADEATPAGQ